MQNYWVVSQEGNRKLLSDWDILRGFICRRGKLGCPRTFGEGGINKHQAEWENKCKQLERCRRETREIYRRVEDS